MIVYRSPISSTLQIPSSPDPPIPPLKVRYRNYFISAPYFFNTSNSIFPFHPPAPPLIPPPTPPQPNPKGKITVMILYRRPISSILQIPSSPSPPHPTPYAPTHPTPNPKGKITVTILYRSPISSILQVPGSPSPPTPPINRAASDRIIGSEAIAKFLDE